MGHGIFFKSQGDELYGFIHPAQGGPLRAGVVFVHGAFEERQDAHLVLRHAADQLAARGIHALRFDLFGHGDSAGEYRDATIERWTDDVVAAARELRTRSGCEAICLLGLRLGAALALRAAKRLSAEGDAPESLVLWSPVLRGKTYAMDSLRAFLAGEMVMHRKAGATREALLARLAAGESVNLFGYPLTPALYGELCALDATRDAEALTSRTLIVDVARAEAAKPAPDAEALARVLGDRARLVRAVESQPLHAEGKLFYAKAERCVAATTEFLTARPEALASP